MVKTGKTFRVFVSSTFSDMKAERTALQENVFPKLKELCLQNSCRFQPIDLRWGVSEEASFDQQTMNICLKELRRCQKITPRPNFIMLLGDRYGWQPLPFEIPETEFDVILSTINPTERELLCWREEQPENKKGWYQLDNNAVAPVYCLRTRTGPWRNEVVWGALERVLRDVLLRGIAKLPLNSNTHRRCLASATAQEIDAGVFDGDQLSTAADHVYCFCRTIRDLPLETINSDLEERRLLTEYLDVFAGGTIDLQAQRSLDCLRDRLVSHLPGCVFFYEALWLGQRGPKYFPITTQHLKQFCHDVYQALSRTILAEINTLGEISPEEEENSAHDSFAREHAASFLGHRVILSDIMDYLGRDSPHPFVISGPMGSGKSVLLAKSIELIRQLHPRATIVARFLGATPASSLGSTLMADICRQLGAGIAPTTGLSEIGQVFGQRLAQASLEKPIILLLDALDKLDPSDPLSLLAWLPSHLPPYVRLVVSTQTPSNVSEILEKRLPSDHFKPLPPLTPDEVQEVLVNWFKGAGRTLTEAQWHTVIDACRSRGIPFYLKLVFEEVCQWRSFTSPSCIPGDISGLIRHLFSRLSREDHHGRVLVSKSLGYLSAARHGLSEDELLEILSKDKEVMEDFHRRSYHDAQQMSLPVVVWARIQSDLDPYLALRRVDNTDLLVFSHRQLKEEARSSFLLETERIQYHYALAKFFSDQPLKWQEGSRSLPNLRYLSELPYHQTLAGRQSELFETLTAPDFVEIKASSGLYYDLFGDMSRALRHWDSACIHQLRQALVQAIPWMARRPELALQFFFNRLKWFNSITPALKTVLSRWEAHLEARDYWLKADAPLPRNEGASRTQLTIETPTLIQAMSSDCKVLAAVTEDGAVELRTMQGKLLDLRQLTSASIEAIALREDLTVAFLNRDGLIGIETSDAILVGRKGEKTLAAHSFHGILGIDQHHSLVAWNPERNTVSLIAEKLPQPLVSLRLSRDGKTALFVAGQNSQVIGVSQWDGSSWRTTTTPIHGAPVVEADLDQEGKHVLEVCLDRSVTLLSIDGLDAPLATLNYELHPEGIQGKPQRVRFGQGETSAGWAFFATKSGHVAAWCYLEGQVLRLENFKRSVTSYSFLALFEVMPDSGRLFYSTETFGQEISQNDGYSSPEGHLASVTSCLITDTEKVVSLSEQDQTVRWFTTKGLTPVSCQNLPSPSSLAVRPLSDEIFVGNSLGCVWIQHPDHAFLKQNQLQVMAERLISLVPLSSHQVLAAGKSGRIVKQDFKKNHMQIVWSGSGFRLQEKILPAGKFGYCWSAYQEEFGGKPCSISIVKGANNESVVVKTEPPHIQFDTAVTPDGNKFSMSGMLVKVYHPVRSRFWCKSNWVLQHQRVSKVNQLAFLVKGEFLAVILADEPWLEVWAVEKGLPTVASIELPGVATCLNARGHRLVVGFQSGDLMSVVLMGKAIP